MTEAAIKHTDLCEENRTRPNLNAIEASKWNSPKRLEANIAAIRLLRRLEKSGAIANPQDQSVLMAYCGWGGLDQAFDWNHKEYYASLRTLVSDGLITETDYSAMRSSVNNAHFTPATVISAIWKAAKRLGFNGGKVLDPASGIIWDA
ncbi:MAG: hypothetical protein V3T17_01000 [Pseudomonadales bacterium]